MHKQDLALNNLQRLIFHKTQQTKPKIVKSSPSCVEETKFLLSLSAPISIIHNSM